MRKKIKIKNTHKNYAEFTFELVDGGTILMRLADERVKQELFLPIVPKQGQKLAKFLEHWSK